MTDEKNTCSNCGYYRQHYIWREEYRIINCGHCVHPSRTRHCRPRSKACHKWIPQWEDYPRLYRPPRSIHSRDIPPEPR